MQRARLAIALVEPESGLISVRGAEADSAF
jgi:hypothetical protein